MNKDVCFIANYAPHYRLGIFQMIDKNISCDFIFGDAAYNIKKLNYDLLQNFVEEVKNIYIFKTSVYFQKKVLKYLFKDYRYWVVTGELHSISSWLMLFFGLLTHRKIMLWSHGWYGREGFFKRIVKKVYFKIAAGTFLYGNYSKNIMVRNGIPEHKLHVIYNSLNYSEQLQIRDAIEKNKDKDNSFQNNFRTLIFIGRLTKEKKLDVLLHAVAGLKKSKNFYNVIIIGSGEEKDFLVQLSNELGISQQISFIGECYDEFKIARHLYTSDLCVSPGNVGLTAIHSMTYGTPVITHDNFTEQMPEFEAIQTNITGLFFKQNSIESLSTVISEWFSINQNRDTTRMLCYKVIDDYYNPNNQLQVFKSVFIDK